MLKQMVTLVTGGASGLGLATVTRFVKQGSKVIIADLPTSNGQKVAESLGSSATFMPMDVTSEAEVSAVVGKVEEKYKQLNVLVNAAGIATAHKIFNHNSLKVHMLETFKNVIEVNTIGTFNVCRLCIPLMYASKPDGDGQRGVIINTASVAAYEGQMGQVAYSASKGAIVGMTLPMARDLSQYGIRVVTIAPGVFDTPLLGALPEKVVTFLSKLVLAPGRLGMTEEYAQLAQQIVENHYLNGTTIRLDAGLRMVQ